MKCGRVLEQGFEKDQTSIGQAGISHVIPIDIPSVAKINDRTLLKHNNTIGYDPCESMVCYSDVFQDPSDIDMVFNVVVDHEYVEAAFAADMKYVLDQAANPCLASKTICVWRDQEVGKAVVDLLVVFFAGWVSVSVGNDCTAQCSVK